MLSNSVITRTRKKHETPQVYMYDKNILILPPGAVINARTMQIKMFLDIQ